MADIEFVDGLMVKKPHENAPDFVKAKISIKREDLIKYLQSKTDEWLNVDVKESKEGKYYASLDNWKPEDKKEDGGTMSEKDLDVSNIPF